MERLWFGREVRASLSPLICEIKIRNERDDKQLPGIAYVKEPLNSKHNQNNPAMLVLFVINKVLQCQNLQSSAERWLQCEAP